MNKDNHVDSTDVLAPILGPLVGAEIPGGCEHCDAVQTVRLVEPLSWQITIAHDDYCPRLAANRHHG